MNKLKYLFFALPLALVCSKGSTDEGVVRIGSATVSKAGYNAFEKATSMYPTDPGIYFPAYRPKITHLVETDVIFRQKSAGKLKDSLRNGADWRWKKRYFPAQLYLFEHLSENLGIPEERIASYYEANKDSFKVTVQIDSTKDSSYYRPLEDVKSRIAEKLFIEGNKPDSVFLSRYDSLPEKRDLEDQWLQHVRQTLPTFFMKRLYKEETGSPYPDSLSEIFGEGKYITQDDMDVILSWIPETRRSQYSAPERKRELVEWLVRWKLFSGISEKTGRSNLPLVKNLLDWAWKLNVAYAYTTGILEPLADSMFSCDSTMLLYSYYDDNGYFPLETNSHALKRKMDEFKQEQKRLRIDSMIIEMRKKYQVTFLQNDWKDIRNQQPAALLTRADSLRDSGKTDEARDAYLTLTKEFALTQEGQTALIELAKIQTEQQLYTQAIVNYRKFLLLNPDEGKRCNTFFMIGFIYDEYLDKPLHAESNYKWVLKNTPGCELADDAEFMMLHLNEPMSSVEELRDEAIRQGRKIDPAEETAPANSADAGSAVDSTL